MGKPVNAENLFQLFEVYIYDRRGKLNKESGSSLRPIDPTVRRKGPAFLMSNESYLLDLYVPHPPFISMRWVVGIPKFEDIGARIAYPFIR